MTLPIRAVLPRIRLIDNWREVLARAWSVRFIAAASLLSGAEVAFPLVEDRLGAPPWVLALFAFLCTAGAFVARLVVQNGLEGGHADR